MLYIAVYGTLRKNEPAHSVFNNYGKIKSNKTVVLSGFKMFDLGAYPAAFETHSKADKIVAELLHFKGDEEGLLEALDYIEGVSAGYYKRKYIKVGRKDKVLIYVMNPAYLNNVKDVYNIIYDWKNKEVINHC